LLSKDTEEFKDNILELVFFGRLETRKGLELFADALDRLAVTRPEFAGIKITFLGRSADIGNLLFL
jgi:glycosyltransferase involved in cell wall biosynthesis